MKPGKIAWRYALFTVALAVIAMVVMDFNRRTADMRRLSNQYEIVAAQASAQVQTLWALEEQLAYATSDAAVLEWAYEDGKMVRQGDQPVVPIAPQQVTPTPTPRPSETEETLSNFERWLELFFGPREQ